MEGEGYRCQQGPDANQGEGKNAADPAVVWIGRRNDPVVVPDPEPVSPTGGESGAEQGGSQQVGEKQVRGEPEPAVAATVDKIESEEAAQDRPENEMEDPGQPIGRGGGEGLYGVTRSF